MQTENNVHLVNLPSTVYLEKSDYQKHDNCISVGHWFAKVLMIFQALGFIFGSGLMLTFIYAVVVLRPNLFADQLEPSLTLYIHITGLLLCSGIIPIPCCLLFLCSYKADSIQARNNHPVSNTV